MLKGTLLNILDGSVEQYGGRTAARSQTTGENWTYEQLREKSRKVAGTLLRPPQEILVF